MYECECVRVWVLECSVHCAWMWVCGYDCVCASICECWRVAYIIQYTVYVDVWLGVGIWWCIGGCGGCGGG